jgi:simple sugar transport system permease protein
MNLFDLIVSIGSATLRMSSPLIFAAAGGICSERCGVINIALEGKMLAGAFTAAAVTYYTHSPIIGFLSGGLAGMFLAAIYAFFVINLRSNQIVTGMAMTILAAGVVPFISQIIFQNTGSTPEIPASDRFGMFPIFFSWVCVFLLTTLFKYSPYGLWHKFAGEHPDALSTSGIDVIYIRWSGVLLSGFLAGLGGATLSICLSSNYTRNMTAGRGYMALAALIVGGWRPMAALFACFAFGLFDSIGITLQSIHLPISPQLIQIIPYILTIVIVAKFVSGSRAPKALGIPYFKNR